MSDPIALPEVAALTVSPFWGLAASSKLKRFAAVLLPYDTNPLANQNVVIYNSTTFTEVGEITIPQTSGFRSLGIKVFFNQASTKLYILAFPYESGPDLPEFVYTFDWGSPCNVSLPSSPPNERAAGAVEKVVVSGDPTCVFSASSNSNWIELVSGYNGSATNTLSYLVRPNPTAQPRSGTITVGNQTLTVTQSAAQPPTGLNPLSLSVTHAAYSKALDNIIYIPASLNELHVYDPIAQTDNYVSLPGPPLSLAVSPDGSSAAVGLNSAALIVNLPSLTITNNFNLTQSAAQIAIPGNGYLYSFSQNVVCVPTNCTTQSATLNVAASNMAANSTTYSQFNRDMPAENSTNLGTPQVSVSGQYINLPGFTPYGKLDIAAGVPTAVSPPNLPICGNNYSQYFLSENGSRLFADCGTVYNASDSASVDFTPVGTFADLTGETVLWAADSTVAQKVAVIAANSQDTNVAYSDNIAVDLFSSTNLSLSSQISLPGFTASADSATPGGTVAGHGAYAFWNNAGSKLFILEQADGSANLLSDFAVYTITEAPNPPNCTFSLNTNSISALQAGGSYTVSVSAPAGCSWTTDLIVPWLTLTSSGTGNGLGSITFQVGASSSPQVANATIGGQPLTVSQAGECPAASYVVSPNIFNFYAGGGSGSITITRVQNCAWSAASSDAPWIALNSTDTYDGIRTLCCAQQHRE